MAKNITIAKLDIDTKSLIDSAKNTAKEIQMLTEQQDKLSLKGKEATNQYMANEAALRSLMAAHKAQTAALAAQITEDGKLVSVKKAVKDAIDQVNNTENDYLANNQRLITLKKQLNSSDDDYEKRLASINGKLQENNSWLTENGSAHAKLITTMDDYKQQVADSFNQINIFNGGLSGLISRAQEAGGAGSLLKSAFDGMSSGIMGMTKAAWGFVSNPIGAILTAIVVAVQLGMAVFKNFTPIVEKVEQGMAAVGAVIETVKNAFTGLFTSGDSAGKFFSNITSGAASAASEAMKLKAAQQELQNQMELQEVTNEKIKNQMDELKRKSQDMTLTEGQRAEAVKKLAKLEEDTHNDKVRQSDTAYNLSVKALQNGANLTKHEEERLQREGFAYLQKLQKVKQFSEEEITALKNAEKKKAEIQNEGIARQQKADKEYAERLEMQNQAREKARDDNERKEENRRQKYNQQLQDKIDGQRLELDILMENQGIKEKAMKDELAYAQKVADSKRSIAQAEFDATKKTANDKLRLDFENIRINKELAKANNNFAMKNAQDQLDAFRKENQSLLKEGAVLSDALLAAEKERMDKMLAANINFLDVKKATGIISEQQYIADVNALYQADTEARQKMDTQLADSKKAAIAKEVDEKATAYENDMAAAEGNYQQQLVLEEQRHNAELVRLKELLDTKQMSEQEYNANIEAENKKTEDIKAAISKAALDNKLSLAHATFGNIAAILGKESAAGKAMAVAQATIDTYQAANKALAAYPPPFSYIAAGAAIVTGLGNVKKIASTKPPKAEKGALFNIGGNRHSAGGTMFTGADGTQFEAEQGELIGVMNRNAARHFMAFNNAFPAGNASSPNYFAGGDIVSREIAQQNLNMDELAVKIAEANRMLPPPVVAVQDIIAEGNSYVRVRDAANF